MRYTTATRYHDISCGHRVVGHHSKCKYLHGHNYRIHFTIQARRLNELGMVLDFGVIKELFCEWLERNWDHRFLIHTDDPMKEALLSLDPESIRVVSFNPTAENMANYLLSELGPRLLKGRDCELIRVVVEETRKCSAAADYDNEYAE